MATMSKFPPDVPKDWDAAADEVADTATGLRSKASDLTEKATDTVKDGFYRAKDAVSSAKDTLSDMDPVDVAREGGEAVMRAVERNPVMAFGLGALSVGLIAWAAMRKPEPAHWWERYQPDYGRLRGMVDGFSRDAQKSGENAAKTGESWLRSHGSDARGYADQARGYAEDGSRLLANRAQHEPIAALLGIGIAVYVLGSLLTGSSEPEAPRRRSTRRD